MHSNSSIVISKQILADTVFSERLEKHKSTMEKQAYITGICIGRSLKPGCYLVSFDACPEERFIIQHKYVSEKEYTLDKEKTIPADKLFWKSIQYPQNYMTWANTKPGRVCIYNYPDTPRQVFTQNTLVISEKDRKPLSFQFLNLLPGDYIRNTIIPTTNMRLKKLNEFLPLLDYGEFLIWISVLMIRMDHMYEEIEDFWHYLSKAMRPRDINMYMTLDRFFTLTSEIALADISICSVEASVEKFEKAFNEKLATKIIPEKYLVLYSRKLSISKHNNEVTTLIDEATSSIIQVNIKTRKKVQYYTKAFIKRKINDFKEITKPWHHTKRTIVSNCFHGTPHIPVSLEKCGLFTILQIYQPGSEYKKMPEYKYIKNLLEKDSEDVALISENPYWYIAPHNAAEDQLIISNCGITTKYIADNQTGKDLPKQTKYQDTVFQEYDSIKDIEPRIKEITERFENTSFLSLNIFARYIAFFLEITFHNLCCLRAAQSNEPISLYKSLRLEIATALQDNVYDLKQTLANVSSYDKAFLEISNILKIDNLDEGFNYFKTGYRQEFIETLVEVAGIQLKAREIEKQV
ncbi:hypothetical protein PHYBLDRAFT_173785 [Phycomyces blakesleeanus NRRL 1555(-)]|uniref:Uncharacterized protein n=1 Tax=Phycomyces blakesleeanus (strain ATCC 8743b / DSM 1359 / FGSC 10004 / NBRC 33097 / NRRL 1555) TaxID=763407 RepID=A0A162TKL3_PHYB8|nr:hypothetical protein PHYBLDRAFT_173785 [Phycomyces blakesleeanus NRRL 1555(-)]OAD67873.1 hypothetical protein PHYBLDRAFT_173785 [Phycomyces blakesleeanus NRRL 1555(-)]|eukprot:XP_018285913.1 hypothetical protein PHYBLDRAFT_173785 [Phycomyces blakesleeanus NRRL 1555(-)]